jgi:hypothetical protein
MAIEEKPKPIKLRKVDLFEKWEDLNTISRINDIFLRNGKIDLRKQPDSRKAMKDEKDGTK